MELPVQAQLLELGWALALGAGMGMLNELLRPVRRGKVLAALADLFWCLTLLIALLGFTIYAGKGRLRAVALIAMAFSGGLLTALFSALRKGLKKLRKKEKIF